MSRHRRATMTMTAEEALAFLTEPELVLTVATIGPSGVPHLVPVFYGLVDDSTLGFLTYRSSQKIKNLESDPRFSALVEDGTDYTELRGVSISGSAQLSDDPSLKRRVSDVVSRRYPASSGSRRRRRPARAPAGGAAAGHQPGVVGPPEARWHLLTIRGQSSPSL